MFSMTALVEVSATHLVFEATIKQFAKSGIDESGNQFSPLKI